MPYSLVFCAPEVKDSQRRVELAEALVEKFRWTVRGPAIQSQSAGLSGPPAGGWGFQKRSLIDKSLVFWSSVFKSLVFWSSVLKSLVFF